MSPVPATPASESAEPLYRVDAYDIEESIGYLLKRVRQMLAAAVDRDMHAHDISHDQWGVLMQMARGRGATAAELARQQECDTGSMTRMIDRLEAKGLLSRTRSHEDRRVVQLELTDHGRAAAEQLIGIVVNVLNRHLDGFSVDELAQFKGFLRRMLSNRAPGACERKSSHQDGPPVDAHVDVPVATSIESNEVGKPTEAGSHE